MKDVFCSKKPSSTRSTGNLLSNRCLSRAPVLFEDRQGTVHRSCKVLVRNRVSVDSFSRNGKGKRGGRGTLKNAGVHSGGQMSIRTCSQCGKETDSGSTACPQCGSPIRPSSGGISRYLRGIAFSAIGIVLFVIVFSIIHSGKFAATSSKQDRETEAVQVSQQFIMRKLKAPWTAQFPSPAQTRVTKGENDQYTVNSYVEARTWEGAIQRKNYECVLRYEPEKGRWHLVKLTLEK